MNINIVDPTTDNRWDNFIKTQELATVFHTSAWARVLKDTYHYNPRYYTLENASGQIEAVLPCYLVSSKFTGKRLVCLPFSDECWPLGEDEEHITLLCNQAKKDVDDQLASYLEIRGWKNTLPSSRLGLVEHRYHLIHLLTLNPDPEKLLSSFHPSIRGSIKQAQKRNITIRFTRSEEDIKKFYMLNLLTRKKLGVLPQPFSFFMALSRHIMSSDLGFLLMAEYEGKPIAGILFLTLNGTIYYKFNASDERYLQRRPNHLLMWEAIHYACIEGFHCLDFGRCSPQEEGLRTYKRRWGTQEMELPYYYYPIVKGLTSETENTLKHKIMRISSRIMPMPIFKASGSSLYRHFG